MFQRVLPFLFSLPSPALLQSARRAAVRSSFLLLDSFPVCIAAPLTGALCPLAIQPAFLHTPFVFRTEDFPCVLPVCKRPKSTLFVRAAFSLLLDKQAAQRLSAAFACIPALPCPPADSFGIGFIAAVIPYTTIHRIFNHLRLICSILVLTSKLPLHQSAGAFFYFRVWSRSCSSGFFRKSPTRIKR